MLIIIQNTLDGWDLAEDQHQPSFSENSSGTIEQDLLYHGDAQSKCLSSPVLEKLNFEKWPAERATNASKVSKIIPGTFLKLPTAVEIEKIIRDALQLLLLYKEAQRESF